MKFLLAAVNAKYIHSNPAIYSLRAYAGEGLAPYIDLAEYTINQRMQDILSDIYVRKPDAVGFSCYIWNWELIRALVVEVKKVLPHTDIWLGGPEVSFDAPGLLKELPCVRGIMVGEGEETFRELLEWYLKDASDLSEDFKQVAENSLRQTAEDSAQVAEDSLRQIAGLCLESGYTAPRALTDLDKIPFLYNEPETFSNRIIYYESSRGCPYSCSYCLSSIDKKVRLRNIEIVKKELQFFLDHHVKQVKFVDRTFNCDHRHAMEIWRYIKEHDNGVTNFHFEISADILREEEIALLSKFRPGLAQLEIGVQSTNPETIRSINRVMNVERLEQIVSKIHKGNNIHLHLDLIAGLPQEDYDSFVTSFNRVYGMRPDQLQLGFLKVLKGSPMEQKAREFGIVYLSRPPYEVLYTDWLSYGDVLKLKRIEEMVELYYNSNQFTTVLPVLERAFAYPFALYEALAEYYREMNYFTESPSRGYRYRILLEFALRYDPEREQLYRELLLYDMYLRENLKSRPDFASGLWDSEDLQERMREFYRREERERRYLPSYEAYNWKQLSKMTHLEPFRYPVWDAEQLQKAGGGVSRLNSGCDAKGSAVNDSDGGIDISGFVLFDYQSRSPLTYEADTRILKKIEADGSVYDG